MFGPPPNAVQAFVALCADRPPRAAPAGPTNLSSSLSLPPAALPRMPSEQGGPVKRTRSGSRRKEYQGAHLDAFPRWRAGGQRVVEGGVERQPGAAVIGTVVHPNEQHLVGLHVREIVPAVRRVVGDPRGLAAHMSVDEVAGDQIVVGEAARV